MLRIKRVYDPPAGSDRQRILVDRLWPRGLSKRSATIDEWMKEIAPSTELRQWFAHDPAKWAEFQRRYKQELLTHADQVGDIAKRASHATVNLVYGARDETHNDAVVLAAVVRTHMARARSAARRLTHQRGAARSARPKKEQSP